jgi:hypothetical protein
MKPGKRGWMAGLIVAMGLLLAKGASAGPYVNVMQPCDCPPTHSSALHVLTPVAYRWAAWCWGPRHYTFAKNLYPSVTPTYYVTKYHCPSINPLQFSVVNYPGLTGPPPGSSHQSPQRPAQERKKSETTPQELPSPRPETKPELLPVPKEEPKK